MTTVSVCIPTYNGAAFLPEQLESIAGQRRAPDQIIVADDGSTDGTRDIVRCFGERHNGRIAITVLDPGPETRGLRANLERALVAANGDVLVLADQDDVWSSGRIEVALEALADPDVDLVVHDAELLDADGTPRGRTQLGQMNVSRGELATLCSTDALRALVRRNVLPGMAFAFRRSLLADAIPLPDSWPHDYWLAVVAGARGGLRVSRDAAHLGYRQHAANLTGARPSSLRARARSATSTADTADVRATMFHDLAERLDLRTWQFDLVAAKEDFERRRSALPRSFPRRAVAVTRIARGYSQFGSAGLPGAALDLMVRPTGALGP